MSFASALTLCLFSFFSSFQRPDRDSDIHGMPFSFQSTEAEIAELFSQTPPRERITPPELKPGEIPDCYIEKCEVCILILICLQVYFN